MIRRPPRSTRTDTLFPYTTLFRSADERRHVAGLMRVNHAGEIAAQALYHGQALTARDPDTRRHLLDAAREERDHLRSEERRVGKECVSTCRSRWSPYH